MTLILLIHLTGCISSIVRSIILLILFDLVFNVVCISALSITLPLLILICELHVLILWGRYFAARQATSLPTIL